MNKKSKLLLSLAASLMVFQSVNGDFATFIAGNVPAIPPASQGEADDPDKDGVPSIIEYLVDGMNPGTPDAHLMPQPVVAGGTLTYTVSKRAGIDGITTAFEIYDVQGAQWSVSTNVTEDASTVVLTETIGETALLARLSVESSGCTIPANNPIAQAYPDEYCSGEYAWTDNLAWDTIIDVTQAPYNAVADGDFANSTGTDNLAAVNAAMAAAHAAGGGVIFFPAGVYFISDHLLIPPGVILRGEDPPAGQDSGSANTLNPPSKLVFPKYIPNITGSGTPSNTAFKKIYSDALAQLDDTDTDPMDFAAHGRIGIVNMDINRAAIILDTPDANPIRTGGAFSGVQDSLRLPPFLPGGSGVGQYFVLYGVRSNNASSSRGAEGVNASEPPRVEQNDWQRTPWAFIANMRVLSGGYAIIANCRVNDLSASNTWSWGYPTDPFPVYMDDSYDQYGYIARGSDLNYYPLPNPGQATFRYSHQYGLSLNGLYFFAKAAKQGAPADPWGNENGWFGSPTSAPWLFRPGHVVRDNYIYSTQGAKMEASGSGLIVKDNVVGDEFGKANFYRQDGWQNLSGSSFLQRGFLLGGEDIVVTGNDITTHRSNNGDPKTGLVTGIQANDNEGIMIDNTTTNVWNALVENNVVTSNIFGYDLKGTEGFVIRNNDCTQFLVSTRSTFPYQDILVENNTASSWHCRLVGDAGTAFNNICRDNTMTGTGYELRITIDAFDEISGNTGFSAIVDTPPN